MATGDPFCSICKSDQICHHILSDYNIVENEQKYMFAPYYPSQIIYTNMPSIEKQNIIKRLIQSIKRYLHISS